MIAYPTKWREAFTFALERAEEWRDGELAGWLFRYWNDPRVWLWISRNPPPVIWNDGPLVWAFVEMPHGWVSGRPGAWL